MGIWRHAIGSKPNGSIVTSFLMLNVDSNKKKLGTCQERSLESQYDVSKKLLHDVYSFLSFKPAVHIDRDRSA